MVNINISIHVNVNVNMDNNNKYLNLLRRHIINHAIILHQHMIKIFKPVEEACPLVPPARQSNKASRRSLCSRGPSVDLSSNYIKLSHFQSKILPVLHSTFSTKIVGFLPSDQWTFLDALASLDFKLSLCQSVSQSVIDFFHLISKYNFYRLLN